MRLLTPSEVIMLKLFRPKQLLVEETSLSRFVHRASSAEKRRIYDRVISEAAQEQRDLIEMSWERRKLQERAHA